MKTVLITGPIGSGKSAVSAHLRSKGYPVYDSDSRCKALYENVPGLKDEIERTLGIPFSELGIIFSDDSKRKALESLVYPLLLEDILSWRRNCGSDICFIESAVAAWKEAFKGLFDEIWLVEAPYQTRVLRNPKSSERDALQSFDGLNVSLRINNDSTFEKLHKTIDDYLK